MLFKEMYLLNGRVITPFKRLFSFKCSSEKISKQNYHKSPVNLNKYDREHDDNKKIETKRNIQALKKFSFIQLEPDSQKSQREPTTQSRAYPKTLDKLKVQIKKEVKKEATQNKPSVVETLANLIDKLEPDKTAKKLFEPFEKLPSKKGKLTEKQGTNQIGNKRTKPVQNQKAKTDDKPPASKQHSKTVKENKSGFQNLLR